MKNRIKQLSFFCIWFDSSQIGMCASEKMISFESMNLWAICLVVFNDIDWSVITWCIQHGSLICCVAHTQRKSWCRSFGNINLKIDSVCIYTLLEWKSIIVCFCFFVGIRIFSKINIFRIYIYFQFLDINKFLLNIKL